MNKIVKRYLVDALSGMALGLFSTLIIGLIIKQIGSFFPVATPESTPFIIALSHCGSFFVKIGQCITVLTGIGIAIGVAHALESPKLVIYASVINGLVGAYSSAFIAGSIISPQGAILLSGPGDPLGALVAALIGAEIGRLVAGKTKVDILVTPFVTIIVGCLAAIILGPPLAKGTQAVAGLIHYATEIQPFFMGIIISVVMGLLLTLPVSSAAIGIILGLSGIAAGAATAGCCAQMVGFAVISLKDNGLNGLVAQGLGTSMLQIPNIVKNPRIWIPPTLASAITGPLATVVFQLKNLPAGSGMGTSGLVGPLLSWQAMLPEIEAGLVSPFGVIIKILLVCVILPAALSYGIYYFMYKKEWIKDGDMTLSA
ncbi:MAG: PTS sugar transporter subunit IIC [Spirochaetaceae bacterium]|nr:PTS sugar transporter subunit IIC [Spirochaetaceae bacterium]